MINIGSIRVFGSHSEGDDSHRPNPYNGLAAFQETDRDRFFGRDPQIEELWIKLRDLCDMDSGTRLLQVYGPSKSGKSSLVRAGLIPALAQYPIPNYESARVALLFPGEHPLESLAAVLAQVAANDRKALPLRTNDQYSQFLQCLRGCLKSKKANGS